MHARLFTKSCCPVVTAIQGTGFAPDIPILPAEKQVMQQNRQFVKRQENEAREPLGIVLVELRHIGFTRVNPMTPGLELVTEDGQERIAPPRQLRQRPTGQDEQSRD